jgi:DNA polymerase III epsilon subunit-like protein
MIFIDVETTGGSSDDQVIEIAAITIDGEVLINELFDPGFPIPPIAARKTGLNSNLLKGHPSFSERAESLKKILSPHSDWAAWNSAFERRFIKHLLADGAAEHDVMKLYRGRFGRGSTKLTDAAKNLALNFIGPPHRALADTEMCLQIYRWLMINRSNETEKPIVRCNDDLMKYGEIVLSIKEKIDSEKIKCEEIEMAMRAFAGERGVSIKSNVFSLIITKPISIQSKINYKINDDLYEAMPEAERSRLESSGIVTKEFKPPTTRPAQIRVRKLT